MRVLVVSSTFPSSVQPTRGVFVRERVRRMATQCEVVVVAPIPWFPLNRWLRRDRAMVPHVERDGELTVHHPRFLSIPRIAKCLDGVFYFLCLVPFMVRLQRQFAFEVIDAHFAYPDGVAATLLARVFRRPVMITLRGSIVRLSTYRLHRPQLRWVLRHADRVVAVSESLRQVALGLGLRESRVRVIRNGVDSLTFRPLNRGEARRLAGLPDRATIIVTVAGIYHGKGQHSVVEALPTLLGHYPDLLYVIAGSARPGEAYRQELESRAWRLGVHEHVRIVGPQPHEELVRWFSAAQLSVLATQSEGWPNVLLESLACGTPVVATRVGGTSEIVRNGRDGFLVPYGDAEALTGAIQEALGKTWDRGALAERARAFGWREAVAEALDELTKALKVSP